MLANPFKMASKNAQNALKTRFSGSPTSKTSFWMDFREVDFFTQLTPFSTFCDVTLEAPQISPFFDENPAFSPPKPSKLSSKVCFSCSPTPKMGGKVTLSDFKSLSTSFYCEKSRFFDFFEWKFAKSTEGAGRGQLFGQCYHIAFESSAQTNSSG